MQLNSGVLLYPGCIFYEVAAAAELMSRFGSVAYFTPDGREHHASNGAFLRPHGSYADLEASPPQCVLVPGGNPDSIIPSGVASASLMAAASHGAVIGGICAGVLVLASAGILEGVKVTHNYTPEHAPAELVTLTAEFWKGIEFVRADVEVDGQFVTAQPWAPVQFASAIAVATGAMSDAQGKEYVRKQTYAYEST